MIEGKMTGGRPRNSNNGLIKNIMEAKLLLTEKNQAID